MQNIRSWFLFLFLVNGALASNNTNATNATTSIGFTNDFDLEQFLAAASFGGGGDVGLGAASDSAVLISQEVVVIDESAAATISVEGAVVSIPAGAFGASVTISVIMVVFSPGTSVFVGVARSAVMRFRASGGRAQAPIIIAFVISFLRRQLASGNQLFLNWLNKKTNSWTPICAPSSFDAVTGEFSTETPPEVFNDPAFNPTSDCAPDLLGPCDGSGGEFTVFEMPESSTCSSDSGRLSDGAIAGIVIGVVAGLVLILIGAWWSMTKGSKQLSQEDAVLSSLVLGQEAAKPPSQAAKLMPVPPSDFFSGNAPRAMVPPVFGGLPDVIIPPPFFGGSPPVMGGMPLDVMPTQSNPVAGAPLPF